MIDLEFDGLKEVKNFRSALRNLWGSTEAQNVMQNPKLWTVEQTETKNIDDLTYTTINSALMEWMRFDGKLGAFISTETGVKEFISQSRKRLQL